MSSPPPLSSPPPGGDEDRGPLLLAVFWTETSLSVLIVASRFYSRSAIKALGADDWAMLATLITLILFCGFGTAYALAGGGRHLYYLSQDPVHASQILKLNWISQPFAIMSLGLGKISVAFLMLRLIGGFVKARRIFLWIIIILTFIFSVVCCVLTFVQCTPTRALWEPVPGAVCWDPATQDDFSLFLGSWNAAVDFILAILPVTIIYKIKISMNKKIGICTLLSLGLLAGVCACVKAAQLSSLTARSDLTWNTFDLLAWTSSETFLLIFCGSASTLRPLLDIIRGRDPYRGSHGYGSGARANRSSNREGRQSARRSNADKLSSGNGGSVSNQTRVESDTGTEDWPLSPRVLKDIQETVEFDVIHERRYSESHSGRSADGGFGEHKFQDVV
ncbi:hypothetical protein MMC10_005122 [Thelotrema lepadinum]|nr:hypothetical protein [Thelotrema lepadinum]